MEKESGGLWKAQVTPQLSREKKSSKRFSWRRRGAHNAAPENGGSAEGEPLVSFEILQDTL